MRFLTISKFLLILFVPFIIFLSVAKLTAFDSSFYNQKFAEYNVKQSVPDAISMHDKVIDFVTGKNNVLPNDFNEGEKLHLRDVRKTINNLTVSLYILILLLMLLFFASACELKTKKQIANFLGKALFFGGVFTLIFAAALFLFISSDFSSAFESFHNLFFEKGTYAFDPAKEMIVRLYPEQLFMDLGLKISKNVLIVSIVVILLGLLLLLKSKSKKNKNRTK